MTLTTTATELPRIMTCIGSRLMPAALPPDFDTDKRDEGNCAHWLAEQMFNGTPVAVGQTAPNGYVITTDMIEHVSQYVSALDCGEMEADTSYSGASWEVRGRADHLVCRTTVEGRKTLTIDDFKYGWRTVSPARNWTLMSHAIGWVIRNQVQPDRIVLRIHQPRPYHPDGPMREWSCTFDELMGFYNLIDQRLSNPTDELTTDTDQCAKCHALANCPAARAASMNAIDAAMLAFSDDLPGPVLAHELETLRLAATMIENRRDALEELMTHRITQGDVFEGWALERRYGQRRFKTGLTGKGLSLALGVDLVKDGLVTPAEAERRGLPKHVLETLVDRPLLPSKLKQIDADAKARAVFGTPTE